METQLKIKDEELFHKIRQLIIEQFDQYKIKDKVEKDLNTKEYESIIIYR